MRALESLERDHRLLQCLSEALEAYVSALESGQPLWAGDLKALVEALRSVADYAHFDKVEEVLIPVLVRNGFDFDLDLLDRELEDHARVRYLLEVLHQSAERELNWSLDERERIARVARHLVEALRRCSARQADELFPELVTRVKADVLQVLAEQLRKFDVANAARSSGLDAMAIARAVLARYVTCLYAPPPAGFGEPSDGLDEAAARARALVPPSQPGLAPSSLQFSRDLPPPQELSR